MKHLPKRLDFGKHWLLAIIFQQLSYKKEEEAILWQPVTASSCHYRKQNNRKSKRIDNCYLKTLIFFLGTYHVFLLSAFFTIHCILKEDLVRIKACLSLVTSKPNWSWCQIHMKRRWCVIEFWMCSTIVYLHLSLLWFVRFVWSL